MLGVMKLLAILAFCLAVAAPVSAQDDGDGEIGDGLDLLGEGTRMLLEGLMDELGPALEGLREKLHDLDAYHPPEMLPNGDIIIRRKTPLKDEDIPEGGIEL
jgi:hypothetical protein